MNFTAHFPAGPDELAVTGALDGYALRFGGVLVEEFPTLMGAERGRGAAREALRMLDRCLERRAA